MSMHHDGDVTNAALYVKGGMREVGTLKVGAFADVSLFELQEGQFEFEDVFGEIRIGEQRLVPKMTIRDGRICALDGELSNS